MPKFIEPYANPNALLLMLTHDAQGDVTVALSAKANQESSGYGKVLYLGSFPKSEFPLGIDLYLSPSIYQLTFDKDVQTSRGSRSGYHGLPAEVWGGNLRFGVRAVNHGEGATAEFGLSDFRIGMAQRQE